MNGGSLTNPVISELTPAKPPTSRQSTGPAVLRRLIHINTRLAEGRRVTAASLAEELEVCNRTIKRDIATLCNEHGMDITWEPSTRTYLCNNPSERLPLLRLTADESIALQLASKTFAAWGGSPLGLALTAALGKIGKLVGNSVSLPVDELGDSVSSLGESRGAEATRRWFALLIEAVHGRKTLRITYHKPSTGATSEERFIDPLHIAYLDHEWTLIAHDHLRNALRQFLLTRIEDIHHTGQGFHRPEDFDAKRYLAGAFGRYAGNSLQEVRVRFDAYAAPYIRERQWHPSQKTSPLEEGCVEVRVRVSHLLDVQRWVLSWGRHAEAIAPDELRRNVAEEIQASACHYKKTTPIPPRQ